MERVIYINSLKTYTLKEYLYKLNKHKLVLKSDINDVSIDYLSYNSKDISKNTLFICKGALFKKEYLEDILDNGVIAYISERKYDDIKLPYIIVKDIRKAMPLIASMYYNEPYKNLKLIGITGTKGKSTTTYYIKYILDDYLKSMGKNESAILSSIDIYDGKIKQEAHLTTPEAIDIQRHFKNAVESNIEFLEMEVSSQGLKYNRVDGITFDVGVYLNISEDHISPLEHPNFEDYYSTKLLLFKQSKVAIVNIDADFSDRAMQQAKFSQKIISFSVKDSSADIYGYNIQKKGHDTIFKVKTSDFDKEFRLTMPGLFNVENALASIAIAYVFNIPYEYIYSGLEKARSSGRMEVYSTKNDKIIAIVDYAHNKLSFEKLFQSISEEYPTREIISIFGCPGLKALLRRRDLPEVASRYSKKIYITAEDPGYEPFLDIAKDIAQYIDIQNCEYTIIEDRGEAIKDAIYTANSNSIILITGKGNETRQKYGAEYIPCLSDVEYTKKYFEQIDS